jgi:hypothetical protein
LFIGTILFAAAVLFIHDAKTKSYPSVDFVRTAMLRLLAFAAV